MKNFKYILTTFFFIFFISNAYSQDKIAILDVIQLLRDSKAAVSMKDQLNTTAKKYTEADKKKQNKWSTTLLATSCRNLPPPPNTRKCSLSIVPKSMTDGTSAP